ncbi:hypothetical protein ACFL6N_00630 [Thermodesulfobacteriota bacterium]
MTRLLSQYFLTLGLIIVLSFSAGCGGGDESDIEGIPWTSDFTGGYDDFGSPGAALGYSINQGAGMIMIVGMEFSLPLNQQDFWPQGNAVNNADLYQWGRVNSVLADDVLSYPLLGFGVTNTAGLRTSLNNSFIGIILKGDFNNSTPDQIFIATSGSIELTRQDDPADLVDGELAFTEVEQNGNSFSIVSGAEILQYNIYYSWDTSDQP